MSVLDQDQLLARCEEMLNSPAHREAVRRAQWRHRLFLVGVWLAAPLSWLAIYVFGTSSLAGPVSTFIDTWVAPIVGAYVLGFIAIAIVVALLAAAGGEDESNRFVQALGEFLQPQRRSGSWKKSLRLHLVIIVLGSLVAYGFGAGL